MVHGMADSLFLSTPSARRATHQTGGRLCSKSISIHALREEGDRPSGLPLLLSVRFLSTPSARRATKSGFCQVRKTEFLSTPSARRATFSSAVSREQWTNFYPRPPRGGRQTAVHCLPLESSISIHALREEGDPASVGFAVAVSRFLSTPSARRATFHAEPHPVEKLISIHALREEGDLLREVCILPSSYFYPRPPRGGRLRMLLNSALISLFLSTPSARRATKAVRRHNTWI